MWVVASYRSRSNRLRGFIYAFNTQERLLFCARAHQEGSELCNILRTGDCIQYNVTSLEEIKQHLYILSVRPNMVIVQDEVSRSVRVNSLDDIVYT